MTQAVLIYVLLALIIVLPIVGIFLKRRARKAGARRWDEKKDCQAAGGGLGTTVIVAADADTVRELVSPVFASGKRVTAQADGTWTQTHYNDDDVMYELVAAPEGTVVAVKRAIEFAGTLNGVKAWGRIREAIVDEAERRGLAVSIGERPLARAEGVEIAGAQVWLPR